MRIIKSLFLFVIFNIIIVFSANATQVAVYSDEKFWGELGSLEVNKIKINHNDFSRITSKDYPIIIFNSYENINTNSINFIKKYLQNNGKIIAIFPQNTNDYSSFGLLINLIGVKYEGFKILQEKTDVNWVEETIGNNTLNKNQPIAILNLDNNSSHLAVFENIEKHETAISYNSNGAVVAWAIFNNGSKKFNEKSLNLLVETFLPKKNEYTSTSNAKQNETLENLNKKIKYLEDYQDNIINYANDLSKAQENLEMAKISQTKADFYLSNGNKKLSNCYMDDAEYYICKSTCGLNNLSSAENHGIWFDRGTIVEIKSRTEMGKYFDKLKKAGINTVYFETLNAGYTIYPSKIAVQNPLTKGNDPLSWAIKEAHERNMQLHAWIWVFAVGNDRHNKLLDKPNDFVGPILEKNMKFALLGDEGNFRPKKQPEFWIDPSNKEATTYLLKIAEEIVQKYNVDGLQLDYIRYPFQNSNNLMGFNHNSCEQFTAKTGKKLFINDYQTNAMWNKWKEENVNNFVGKISQTTKRYLPNLKISAAVFSKKYNDRLSSIQQNYETWITNNYIDSLTPMSYSISIDALKNNLTILEPQISSCLIYPGIALKHVDNIKLLEQISLIRNTGYLGTSFFAVAQLDDDLVNFLGNHLNQNNSFNLNTNELESAKKLLNDFYNSIMTIYSNDYTLSPNQKRVLNSTLSNTQNAIYYINMNQIDVALDTLKSISKTIESFLKKYNSSNKKRNKILYSYLKRVENILKIQIKTNKIQT